MGQLIWWLVVREERCWKWYEAIDGVEAETMLGAARLAAARNPVKPGHPLRVERAGTNERSVYASQMHRQRNDEIAALKAIVERCE